MRGAWRGSQAGAGSRSNIHPLLEVVLRAVLRTTEEDAGWTRLTPELFEAGDEEGARQIADGRLARGEGKQAEDDSILGRSPLPSPRSAPAPQWQVAPAPPSLAAGALCRRVGLRFVCCAHASSEAVLHNQHHAPRAWWGWPIERAGHVLRPVAWSITFLHNSIYSTSRAVKGSGCWTVWCADLTVTCLLHSRRFLCLASLAVTTWLTPQATGAPQRGKWAPHRLLCILPVPMVSMTRLWLA